MKLDSMQSVYVRELDGFYEAVDRLQEGLMQLAKTGIAERLPPELEHHLVQMRDLGSRLERIFALITEESLRTTCKTAHEVFRELKLIEPDSRDAPSLRVSGQAMAAPHLGANGKIAGAPG